MATYNIQLIPQGVAVDYWTTIPCRCCENKITYSPGHIFSAELSFSGNLCWACNERLNAPENGKHRIRFAKKMTRYKKQQDDLWAEYARREKDRKYKITGRLGMVIMTPID
ncbi:MAG: hypothetical protein KAV87_00295 [Desulfobacteraceae bacterium]|nr:hypothetical protein [Desulfobacteraceae bacterium]